ncbi:MAG: hypothetical protein WA880_07410, partial [Ornithinimicrobium sp.]
YYVVGFFPLLLAAASVWVIEGSPRARRVAMGTITWFAVVGVVLFLPLFPARWLPYTPILDINTDAGETIGWPAFVATVGQVHDENDAEIVIGDNYGEAGAMLHFRPDIDTFSPHNSLYDVAQPPASAQLAVMVGFEEDELEFCDSLEQKGSIDNGLDVDNEEQGQTVWLCATTADWTLVWPRLRHLN